MAAYHLKRKLNTYRSLYQLNRAFSSVSYHVWQLERAGFMPIVKMRIFQGLVKELQSLISHDVVNRMHGVEDEDSFRYGQIRIKWEHSLNPEKPPLNT